MRRSALGDAAAVASAVCQITKHIILPQAAATAPKGPPRPWPTKVRAEQINGDPSSLSSVHSDRSEPPPSHPTPSPVSSPQQAPQPKPKPKPWSTQIRAAQKQSLDPSSFSPSDKVEVGSVESVAPAKPELSQARPTEATTGARANDFSHNNDPSVEEAGQDEIMSPIEKIHVRSDQLLSNGLDQHLRGHTDARPVQAKSEPQPPAPSAASTPPILPAASPDTAAQPNSEHHSAQASADQPTSAANASTTSKEKVAQVEIEDTKDNLEAEEYDAATEVRQTPLRAAKVPSSRLGRLFHYGGLGAGLALGAAGQLFRGAPQDGAPKSLFMSEQNVARLVDKLSTMRGAALKLGQFLSIQETKLLPPQIENVLHRVQNSANYMPAWQMDRVMQQEYGCDDWRDRYFAKFDEVPFASASIGQVHSAVLREDFADPSMAGKRVAVKIQFPGVFESIDSDLSYIRWLVSASALLPKGLFLENSLKVMSRELKDECDYTREAEMGRRFYELLKDSDDFEAPRVVDSLSKSKVLVTEMMRGRPLTQALRYSQEKRDKIAESILQLSLTELFRFRLMQTDPNWSNFLYNERNGKIQLIDFGATREYSKEFMDDWLRMLQAAIRGNHRECIDWSRKVGYLTGEESEQMERAHVESMIALGEPFRQGSPDPYPFEHQTITDRVKEQIPLMLRERLTPPPQETYSLNRKLSGAFLLCARLRANVHCQALFERVEREYRFGSTPAASNFGSDRREYHTSRILREVQRRHGINLSDRFPRSRIVLSDTKPDTVETLSSGSVAPMEGPQEIESGSLERDMIPAEKEVPKPSDTPMTATLIRGITIPLKPPPPGPEECCMSGCAHCAYDIYAEDLEDFHSRLQNVREQLVTLEPPVTRDEWRDDLLGAFPDSTASGTEDLKEKAEKEVDRVIGTLDPTMKAFLEMERKMKKKEKEKEKAKEA